MKRFSALVFGLVSSTAIPSCIHRSQTGPNAGQLGRLDTELASAKGDPAAADGDWTTLFERSGGTATPRFDETLAYCQRLADHSPMVALTHFGTSPQGRKLPLLIVDRRGNTDPQAVRASGNAVILVQAAIHAGEVSGKDAGMMLIRDIVQTGALASLLEHVTLLFVPIFNVDGHERFGPYNRINQNGPEQMGWRTNARNLNLNRDFLKVDSREMRAWLKLFTAWLPDFIVDTHATDGANYQYEISYGLERHDNVDRQLASWNKRYLRDIEKRMSESGYSLAPYVTFKKWHDPRSGLVDYASTPRYSHGYAAMQNRPGLLIETHMLKSYATRVAATYEMLKHTMILLNEQHTALTQIVRQADEHTKSAQFRSQPFPLRMKTTDASVGFEFKGVTYDVLKSEVTGGQWFRYSNQPQTYTIPYQNDIVPSLAVALPRAYIVPPQWHEVIERLRLHGVSMRYFERDVKINVRSYRFKNVKWEAEQPWQTLPYEGRHLCRFDTETIEEIRMFPVGSALIETNQRTARIIAHILEPDGPDSFVHWGFFNGVFQRTEYVESYVIEEMAREMLRDPAVAAAFAQAKQRSAAFANNPNAIRQWFYQRTPYFDAQFNVYPVGLVDDEENLDLLLTKAIGATSLK